MDLDKAINNVSFSNDKKIEENKVRQKKRFGTAYVEEVNNKYKIYTPDDDMKDGYDCYTDEPLYSLCSNQYYAIIVEWSYYDYLVDNDILDIESELCVISPAEFDHQEDCHMFLFQDYFNFQYEREKLYIAMDEENI